MINYKEQVNDPRWVERSHEIMKRDNFTCQLCCKSHTKLNVHHIRYIKGKDYWDYPDELLMTVCEVCHAKIHGKYNYGRVDQIKDKNRKKHYSHQRNETSNKDKRVIFKNLFMYDKLYKLSYNTQMVLSLLIWDSMKQIGKPFIEIWSNDKSNLFISEYLKGDNVSIKSKYLGEKYIEKECLLPHSSVSVAMKDLSNIGLIKIDKVEKTIEIFARKEMFHHGYIELFYPSKENSSYIDKKTNKEVKINSHDIIIYSYLKYKSKKYDGCIDTYISKLAIELSVCERDIKRYLARLKEFGLIERLNNGKLKIN